MTKESSLAILITLACLTVLSLAAGSAIIADYGAGRTIVFTLAWIIPSVLILVAVIGGLIAGDTGAETTGEWLTISFLTFLSVMATYALIYLVLAGSGLPVPAPFGILSQVGLFI